MGNSQEHETTCNRINSILDIKEDEQLLKKLMGYYQLSCDQSTRLLDKYDQRLASTNQYFNLNGSIMDCPSISFKREKNPIITDMRRVGYYMGNMLAFRFKDNERPYILFEFNNDEYESSKGLLKMIKNKKEGDGMPTLTITTLVSENARDAATPSHSKYYIVKSVSFIE